MPNEPPKENLSGKRILDVDRFLESSKVVNLGVSPESDANGGFFNTDSRIFATLGKKFGNPLTRTVLLEKDGNAIVTESLESIPCRNESILGREKIGGDAVSARHAKVQIKDAKYYFEDLDSSNGTILFKPENIKVDGLEKELDHNVAAINLDDNFKSAYISFGDSSIIRFNKSPPSMDILLWMLWLQGKGTQFDFIIWSMVKL